MKKKKRKRKKKTKLQETKLYMRLILIVSLIDMQFPFILAFIGRDQIAETLAKCIVVGIVIELFTYCCKSFFETKEEHKNAIYDSKYSDDLEFFNCNDYQVYNEEETEESMR